MTLSQLAEAAVAGDKDAALVLARRAPCKGFPAFVVRWVPEGALTPDVFDRLCDAYHRMELEKYCENLDTKEAAA